MNHLNRWVNNLFPLFIFKNIPFNRLTFRRFSIRRACLILLIICIVILIMPTFIILSIHHSRLRRANSYFPSIETNFTLEDYFIKTKGCRIPNIQLYHGLSSEKKATDIPLCNDGLPPLIKSNSTHLYLSKLSLSEYLIDDISSLKCCYSPFIRKTPRENETDTQITVSEKCVPINNTSMINVEYVKVNCTYYDCEIYRDCFAFVPVKPKLKKLKSKQQFPLMNVLIIGLEGISRVSFNEKMYQTRRFLEHRKAVQLFGYTKLSNDTFENLIAILTGLTKSELVKECWPTKYSRFDKCPFIWKEFNKYGYVTAFAEDLSNIGLFGSGRMGFVKQPTDYFWTTFDHLNGIEIGNNYDKSNVHECVGSKLVYESLVEYIEKFVYAMHTNKLPYFGLFWSASITYGPSDKLTVGDFDYVKVLKTMENSGMFNSTVLIFVSDHGQHWNENLPLHQKKLEERLPMLFICLPAEFVKNHQQAYTNLKTNEMKLSTPFDLHETLKNLIDAYSLTDEILNKSEERKSKRGYSLFQHIPINRTCDEANINVQCCACQQSRNANKDDPIVKEAAEFAVEYINEKLKEYPNCAALTLAEIFSARLYSLGALLKDTFIEDYDVVFRTTPGDALFEGIVRLHRTQDVIVFDKIVSTINRINLQGYESSCVDNVKVILYCYCKV